MTSSPAVSALPPSPDLTGPATPSHDVALSYWISLSRVIDSVAVLPDATSSAITLSTAAEAAVYTRYTLHGILVFCGIKQHRVQQTVDHMIAVMLSAAFAAPQSVSAVAPRLVQLSSDAALDGPRRATSLPLLIRDWLLLPASDAKACPSVRHHHHHHRSDYQLQVHAAAWERAIVKSLGKELRGQMISLRPLLRWNMACAQQAGRTPIVVLIGGTSGSGKSTLARLVASQLRIANVLSTDTVRQILRARLAGHEKDHPTLFVSTYEAYKAVSDSPSELRSADVVRGYESQCALVLQVLDGMLRRLLARGESVVIEGVHLLPTYLAAKRAQLLAERVICVPVLVRIPKADGHLERFCVRSRGMSLQSQNNKYIASFQAIRIIQSHLVTAVEEADLQVLVLTNTNVDKSFLVLHHAVLETMEHTALHGWPADAAATAQVPLTPLAFTETKRRLVAVVRQRRTCRSTASSNALEDAHDSENAAVREGRSGQSTVSPTPEGTLLNSSVGLVVATTSRARSAELLTTLQRRLTEHGVHCPPRQSSGGHADPSAPRPHPADVSCSHAVSVATASRSPATPSLPFSVRRSPVFPGPSLTAFSANDDTAATALVAGRRSARGVVSPFRAAPPRRSTTTSAVQPSSLSSRTAAHSNEELFDEVEMPSLMGS